LIKTLFFIKPLDKPKVSRYNIFIETVEAEITVIMPPQRACVAESQVKHRSSNGPPRVQSNGMGDIISSSGVFCNVRMCVNHQEYDSTL